MNQVEEIKNKLDIVDIVGTYVSLKKAGSNFKGLCPFHHEKSGSFMVNPERQIFKCFGCGQAGDVVTFIQEIEQLEFVDALRLLAERAGLPFEEFKRRQPASTNLQGTGNQDSSTIPEPGSALDSAPSPKLISYQINKLAVNLFHKILISHPAAAAARSYLAKRRVTPDTIAKWQIGYAPPRANLTKFFTDRGFTTTQLTQAGRPERFFNRIMFPITDTLGQPIAFTGRILGEGEPKYLNTGETHLFHKSRTLFGLAQARKAIKAEQSVIVTEGQMDVILSHQAGVEHVVASSGTALTSDHLRILARYDAKIIFAFDADGAGTKATQKAIGLAIELDLSPAVIPLPAPYKDIGEVVEADPKLWAELAKSPQPALEWEIDQALAPYIVNGVARHLTADEKKLVAKTLLPRLRQIPNMIERAHYLDRLASRLEIAEAVLRQELERRQPAADQSSRQFKAQNYGQGSTQPGQSQSGQSQTRQSPTSQSQSGQSQSGQSQLTNNRSTSQKLSINETIYGLMELNPGLRQMEPDLFKSLNQSYNGSKADLIFRLKLRYPALSEAEAKAEFVLLVSRYRAKRQEQRQAEYATKIQQAEAQGDIAAVKGLLAEFQNLLKAD